MKVVEDYVLGTKKSVGAYVYLPQEWSKGARKIDKVKIL